MTEFFIARPLDIASVDFDSVAPRERFPTIQAGGLWHVNVVDLESIVTGVPAAKLLTKDSRPRGGFVWQSEDGEGPLVTAFSPKLTAGLVALDRAGCERVGTEWARSLGDPAIFVELVGDLRLLSLTCARASRWCEAGKRGAPKRWNVYLWSAL